MDNKLQELITNFHKKLSEAQDARLEVMNYLEEQYDIDTDDECETLEDECTWCYGINMAGVSKLINK